MRVSDWVKEEELVQILQNLIRIRTTLPRGDEMDCAKYIMSLFAPYKVGIKLLDHGGNRASLKITMPGATDEKTLAIVGHMDTLGVDNPDSWNRSPFGADIEGRRVYGKGTINVKGGLASMIAAGLAMARSGRKPTYPVALCFSADEEMDGTGAGALLKSGLLDDVDELIVVEPTSLNLGMAGKGAIWLKIVVQGRRSHSATPDRGINSIEKFMEFSCEVRKLFSDEAPHRLLGHSTCTVTELRGGSDPNVVPSEAEGILDIRILPSVDQEKLMDSVEKVVSDMESSYPPLKISVQAFNVQAPVGMSSSSPMIKRLKEICQSLSMRHDEIGIHPFTDASRLVPALGVPFVIFGPGDPERSYQDDEWVCLDQVLEASELYYRYGMELG
nr:M20 family metallopeptidase [uncultured Dethiosulfovibrio sp.]